MSKISKNVVLSLCFVIFHVLCMAASPKQPNIVVILTDDQDLRLGSLDKMDNVQKLLIQEGTYFKNHYGHMSQCCPSRATIWTGKHAHNTNVTTIFNSLPGGGYEQFSKLGWNKKWLPVYLQNAGYQTYFTGKSFNGQWINEQKGDLNSTRQPHGFTWGMHCKYGCLEGLDEAYLTIDPSTYVYYKTSFAHYDGQTWEKIPGVNGTYQTDQLSDYVTGFIEKAAGIDRPFFAVAATVAPHIPATPKTEYLNAFPELIMDKSPNFNPANRSGVNAVWEQDELSDENVVWLDNAFRQRQQTLISVDELVENVINKLNETGALDNTYIIYTSDNGYHLGNHRLQGGKFMCFEEDVNLPFIIRGPNVAKGAVSELVTGHIDIAPTILTLAGYGDKISYDEIGVELDGTAITFPLETAADTERNVKARGDTTHVEFWGPFWQEWNYLNTSHGKGSFTYKALRARSPSGSDTPYDLMYSVWCQEQQHELYDMTWDEYQMSNLHPDAPIQHGNSTNLYNSGQNMLLGRPTELVIERLDALVLVLKTCSDDSCRWPWKQLHPDGSVSTLIDALDEKYDNFYANSYKVAPVGWLECYVGYKPHHSSTLYSIANEQPAWINPSVVSEIRSDANQFLPNWKKWLAAWMAYYCLKSFVNY